MKHVRHVALLLAAGFTAGALFGYHRAGQREPVRTDRGRRP